MCITSVHWNLHKKVWSVTQSGKPVKHVRSVTILSPRPHIGEGKYQETQAKGARKVCAWIKGELADYQDIQGRAFSYNPMKSHDFYYLDNNNLISSTNRIASFSIDANGKPVSVIK
jgi:hypothetical protein